MNKTELIAIAAENAGMTKKDTERVLNAALDAITLALVRGEKVQLSGFGTFETKNREARVGRYLPSTQELRIPFPQRRLSLGQVFAAQQHGLGELLLIGELLFHRRRGAGRQQEHRHHNEPPKSSFHATATSLFCHKATTFFHFVPPTAPCFCATERCMGEKRERGALPFLFFAYLTSLKTSRFLAKYSTPE